MRTAPVFDPEGYQSNMNEINGEALPDVSKLQRLTRLKAGLPSATRLRQALAELRATEYSSYVRVRKKIGLTQEQFAATIGVKFSTYRQWEQGRRIPSGPAMSLLRLLATRPLLIHDLQKYFT